MTIDLRNTTPNRGGLYYFFNAFSVPVPAGAEKVRARSGGSSLPVSLRGTDDPSTRLARISFPNLLYGRSRTITLTFEVPGEKPRAKDSTRVGPGYATFAVYGVGDAGRNTVEVVAPSAMTFEATSDDFTASEQGSTTTHTSTATSDEGGFWAVVSLRDPNRTDERVVDVAGVSLLLNGFQDDPKWGRLRRAAGDQGHPRPREARRREVARWPGAHPRGRLAVAARLRRLVRPDRRRDRHRRAARRRPDLPRALARLGLRRAVRRAVGVRGPGPGARRAGGRGHRWHAHHATRRSRAAPRAPSR